MHFIPTSSWIYSMRYNPTPIIVFHFILSLWRGKAGTFQSFCQSTASYIFLKQPKLTEGLPPGFLCGAPARELHSDALGSEAHCPGERAPPPPGILVAVWLLGCIGASAGILACQSAGKSGVWAEGDGLSSGHEATRLTSEGLVDALEAIGQCWGLFCLHAPRLLTTGQPCCLGACSLSGQA